MDNLYSIVVRIKDRGAIVAVSVVGDECRSCLRIRACFQSGGVEIVDCIDIGCCKCDVCSSDMRFGCSIQGKRCDQWVNS